MNVYHMASNRSDFQADYINLTPSALLSSPFSYSETLNFRIPKNGTSYYFNAYVVDFNLDGNRRNPRLGVTYVTLTQTAAILKLEGTAPTVDYPAFTINRLGLSYIAYDYTIKVKSVEFVSYATVTYGSINNSSTSVANSPLNFKTGCFIYGAMYYESYLDSASTANLGYNIRFNLTINTTTTTNIVWSGTNSLKTITNALVFYRYYCPSPYVYNINTTSCLLACNDGFFASQPINYCLACLSSCLTCSNLEFCLTCPMTNSSPSLIANQGCLCYLNYYLSGSSCLACHISCKTCSGQLASQCLTCPLYSNINGSTCSCQSGYYQDSYRCVACNPLCLTCNSTGCLSCSSSLFRTLSGSACVCMSRYYQTNSTCLRCIPSCLTCSVSASRCLTCSSADNRVQSSNSCPCSSGYFDSGLQACSACHFSCLTCQSTGSNGCLSCLSNSSRILSNYSCNCITAFYETNSSSCLPCGSGCQSCSNAAHCDRCKPSFSLINNTCSCTLSQYFQRQSCQACDLTCQTCKTSGNTSCITCQETTRIYSEGSCPCLEGFNEVGLRICTNCDFQCYSCNYPSISECTECAQSRQLQGTACVCRQGFFQVSQPQCKPCNYACQACLDQSVCLVCAWNRIYTQTGCQCPQNTYDNGKADCPACPYSCSTCKSQLICLTCQPFRTLVNDSCPCQKGMFQTNSTCMVCNNSCLTCSFSADNCLSCNQQQNKELIQTRCECMPGYFFGNETCLACSDTCSTCLSINQCSACKFQQQRLSAGSCLCPEGTFFQSLGCSLCDSTCLTCEINKDKCITCQTAKHFVLEGTICKCTSGFYMSNSSCLACSVGCSTCSSETICLTCQENRTLQQGDCLCNQGFYQHNASCDLCKGNCKTCLDDAFVCLACLQGSSLVNSSCVCNLNYFLDSQQGCTKCPVKCNTCQDSSSCLTCASNSFRNNTNNCQCQVGYKQADKAACQLVNNCLRLSADKSFCEKCPQNMYSNGQFCVNQCPLSMFPLDIVCTACVEGCSYCGSRQICYVCNNNYKIFKGACVRQCPSGLFALRGFCANCVRVCATCSNGNSCNSCISKYYLDKASGLCQKCQDSCFSCYGYGADKCSSCSVPSVLIKNKCIKINCLTGMFFDNFALSCANCPANCTACIQDISITTRVACSSCLVGTFLSDKSCKPCSQKIGFYQGNLKQTPGVCIQICGDAKKFQLACDDGNTVNGDGCNSVCQVEQGYICQGGSANSKDRCTPSRPMQIKILQTTKISGKNRVLVQGKLFYYPNDITSGQIESLITLNIPQAKDYNYTVQFFRENGTIFAYIDYKESINALMAQLSIDTPKAFSLGIANAPSATNSVAPLSISPTTPANFQSPRQQTLIQQISRFYLWGSVGLLILAAASLLFGKMQGVQLISYIQLSFLSTQLTQNQPAFFRQPLNSLKYSVLYSDHPVIQNFTKMFISEQTTKNYDFFHNRTQFLVNSLFSLSSLILIIFVFLILHFFNKFRGVQNSRLYSVVLPKLVMIASFPILFFAALFLFNLSGTGRMHNINLALTFISLSVILLALFLKSNQLRNNFTALIQISKKIQNQPQLYPQAKEIEDILEPDLKRNIVSQFYVVFFWMMNGFSVLIQAYSQNVLFVKLTLIIMLRSFVVLIVLIARPYNFTMQNIRVVLSQLAYLSLIGLLIYAKFIEVGLVASVALLMLSGFSPLLTGFDVAVSIVKQLFNQNQTKADLSQQKQKSTDFKVHPVVEQLGQKVNQHQLRPNRVVKIKSDRQGMDLSREELKIDDPSIEEVDLGIGSKRKLAQS